MNSDTGLCIMNIWQLLIQLDSGLRVVFVNGQWVMSYESQQNKKMIRKTSHRYSKQNEQDEAERDNFRSVDSKTSLQLPTINQSGSIRKNVQYRSFATQVTPRQKTVSLQAKSVSLQSHNPQSKAIESVVKNSSTLRRSKTHKNIEYLNPTKSSISKRLPPSRLGFKFIKNKEKDSYAETIEWGLMGCQIEQMSDAQLKESMRALKSQIIHYNDIMSEILSKNETKQPQKQPTIARLQNRAQILSECVKNNEKMILLTKIEVDDLKQRERFLMKYHEEDVDAEIENIRRQIALSQKQIKQATLGMTKDSKILLSNQKVLLPDLRDKIQTLREKERFYSKKQSQLLQKLKQLTEKVTGKKVQQTSSENTKQQNTSQLQSLKTKIGYLRHESNKTKILIDKQAHQKQTQCSNLRLNIQHTNSQIKNYSDENKHLTEFTELKLKQARLNEKVKMLMEQRFNFMEERTKRNATKDLKKQAQPNNKEGGVSAIPQKPQQKAKASNIRGVLMKGNQKKKDQSVHPKLGISLVSERQIIIEEQQLMKKPSQSQEKKLNQQQTSGQKSHASYVLTSEIRKSAPSNNQHEEDEPNQLQTTRKWKPYTLAIQDEEQNQFLQ